MARDERDVFDRANDPLAKKLRKIAPDTKALANALGCSVQAVNQYKQGMAYPKTENLIKIADFCGVSVDYLLGITDVPTRNTTIQAIHEYTGLSEKAIERITVLKTHKWGDELISILNDILESEELDTVLGLMRFAEKNVDSVDSKDREVWAKLDNVQASISSDGMQISLTHKEAARHFLAEAKEAAASMLSIILVGRWNKGAWWYTEGVDK